MAVRSLLDGLVEGKTLRILLTLCKHPDQLYHLNSLAKASKVPLASTSRIITRLKKHDIIKDQKIGKMKLYTLADNKKTQALRELLK